MIICNGPPKSGTNTLLRIMGLCGFQYLPYLHANFRKNSEIVVRQVQPDGTKGWGGPGPIEASNFYYVHAHIGQNPVWPTSEHLHFVMRRHPRNILVSHARELLKKLERDEYLHLKTVLVECILRGYSFSRFSTDGVVPIVQRLERFDYKDSPAHYVIRYEDMEKELARIMHILELNTDMEVGPETSEVEALDFLLLNYKGDNTYEGEVLYNEEPTWTGRPSKWEDVWDEELEKLWADTGGPELEERWNY